MFNYEGRIVVVTGASSGLGKQMSKAYARQGATGVIMARRVEKLEELANEIKEMGRECFSVKCDVTNVEEVNSAAIFLGAEESSYVTGVILPIDGGYTCV